MAQDSHARPPFLRRQGCAWRLRLLALAMLAAARPAMAGPAPLAAGDPGLMCRSAVAEAERGSALPPHLLAGIARVESGRRDPVTGRFNPWPWSINAEGRDHVFDTKAEAVAFARSLQEQGVRSFDVGCLQINLMYHPDAFASLEDAFDPLANARYAVSFLTALRQQTGSWETASAWYHSATPEEGGPYRNAVVTAMAAEANALLDPAASAISGSATFGSATFGSATFGSTTNNSAILHGMAAGFSLRSLPVHPGVMLLRSGSAGMSAPIGAYGATFAPVVAAAVTGRGLDAYRMRPVALVAFRVTMPPRFH